MWPWDELGLAPTGDERLIRKAYAERARQCRPDDDSAGFIRLRAAYEAALAAAAAKRDDADGKVVRLDGFRDRPAPPKPEPEARPTVEPPPPKPQPVVELVAKEPILPRNVRVRIERVGESGPADAPKPRHPAAAPKPNVRIERVAPAADAACPPSPPPARPRVRIERVTPETERAPSDVSAESEECPPGKS
jgi:hypothetical protein